MSSGKHRQALPHSWAYKKDVEITDVTSMVDVPTVVSEAAPVSEPQLSEIVKPVVKFDGDATKHALATLFDGPSEFLPIITSIGIKKIPDLSLYIAYKITSRGKEILNIEVTEPNHKAIVRDELVMFFEEFFEVEEE